MFSPHTPYNVIDIVLVKHISYCRLEAVGSLYALFLVCVVLKFYCVEFCTTVSYFISLHKTRTLFSLTNVITDAIN